MQIKDIEYLLKELNIVREKYQTIYDAQEKFNIFTVLHKPHDERRLHSRFIAALLAPDASHRRGDAFLRFFLETLDIKNDNFTNAEVYPKEWDKKENANIDILIIDRVNKHAIIIENKIYAGDSNTEESGQIERYVDHVKDNENIPLENITAIYLTLDGHEPTDESLGKYKDNKILNFRTISYQNEILTWLNKCLTIVAESPFLRESIIQYKKLIEKMTGEETTIEQRKEIKRIIGKNEENLMAAKMLYDNFKHVKWHTVADFWNELKAELEKNGFKVLSMPTVENITDLTHYESYRKGQRNKQSCGIIFNFVNNVTARIWTWADSPLYWGIISGDETNLPIAVKQKIEDKLKDKMTGYIQNKYHYFFKHFFEGEKEIKLANFSHEATFRLINDEYRQQVVKQIVEEIKRFKEEVTS